MRLCAEFVARTIPCYCVQCKRHSFHIERSTYMIECLLCHKQTPHLL